ncbi:uncharacterized protein LOC106667238 isoform X2 [Cimex lectularius]|uniref:Uncharacterized protein n=1 Tax=Cimex lectularius TaxID=79782 RepID=A0A8I6RUR9_CIMLE|nr:uncharacterized protein LOC106667238 isoform X2 [Cimex lectularius]
MFTVIWTYCDTTIWQPTTTSIELTLLKGLDVLEIGWLGGIPQSHVPAVHVKSSVDNGTLTDGSVTLYENGISLIVKKRANDVYEFQGNWRWLTFGGDTEGEFHASVDWDQLKIHTDFNLQEKFVFTVHLHLQTLNGVFRGDKTGLQTYEVTAGSSRFSLKVSGKAKGFVTNYQVHTEVPFELADVNSKLVVNFDNNDSQYKALSGALWLGPVGLQVDFDNKGKFFCIGHLNFADVFKATARVNTNNGYLKFHSTFRYSFEHAVINAEVNADLEGAYDVETKLALAKSLHLKVKIDKKGNISGGIRFEKNGYGFQIDSNTNANLQIEIVANEQNSLN